MERAAFRRWAIAGVTITIPPVLPPREEESDIEIRGLADVVGRSWNPGRTLLLSVIAVFLVWTTGVAVTGWARAVLAKLRVETGSTEPASLESAWRQALDELDRIKALGLHTMGQMDEFYSRSTAAVRTFVETLDPAWTRGLTSHELMGRLPERVDKGRTTPLAEVMKAAEVVKFGRYRPEERVAESDWESMRGWIHDFARGPQP